MTAPRFEPLDPRRFPPGKGPFRVRGVAYVAVLSFVDRRLPGGRAKLGELLGAGDPFAAYLDQLFVVTGDYDISPLVRLQVALAGLEGVAPGPFVVERARRSASQMVQGMWKPVLKTTSPEAMAERLPFAFNRFFEPTISRTLSVAPGRFEAEITRMPGQMSGMHISSTEGFVSASLELSGAKEARVSWHDHAPEGQLEGVPVERARFVATWR